MERKSPVKPGVLGGRSPLGEGVESNEVRTRGIPPPPSNQSVIPSGHYFCNFIPAGLEFY